MSLNSLSDLFLDLLKDTYDAERQLSKALPKMAKACSDESLRTAFEEHLEETQEQIQRLEKVFEMLGKPARGKKCVAMQGLIEEGKEIMEEEAPDAVLDAAIIAAAQKVEHYEIAAYGTLATYAEILELEDALPLLKQTLDEEKQADLKLTEVASSINYEAQQEEQEVEEE